MLKSADCRARWPGSEYQHASDSLCALVSSCAEGRQHPLRLPGLRKAVRREAVLKKGGGREEKVKIWFKKQ